MRPAAGDLVDVVEIDGVAVRTRRRAAETDDPADADAGSTGPDADYPADEYFGAGPIGALLTRWRWWRRARPGDRQLAGIAAALLVIALAVGYAAAVHDRPVQQRQVKVWLAAGPPGVDAAGCPLSRVCGIRPSPALAAVVARLAPQLPVVTTTEVYDLTTATIYRREVFAQSRSMSATLWVLSQCLPTSAPASDQPVSGSANSVGPDGAQYETYEWSRVSLVGGCVAYARAAYPVIFDQLLSGVNSAILGIIYTPQALAGS